MKRLGKKREKTLFRRIGDKNGFNTNPVDM
jgi:hypothetical protein